MDTQKLIALHPKAGFAFVEVDRKEYLVTFPYNPDNQIEIENKAKILDSEGWYVFNKPRNFPNWKSVQAFMEREHHINNVLVLSDFERKINMGKLIFISDEELKVEKIIEGIKKRIDNPSLIVDNIAVVSAVSHIHSRSQEQQKCLSELLKTVHGLKTTEDYTYLPGINHELSSLMDIHQLIGYIKDELVIQKRFNIGRSILGFFIANKENLGLKEDEMTSINKLYEDLREKNANASGYSTYSNPKKAVGKGKKFLSTKR